MKQVKSVSPRISDKASDIVKQNYRKAKAVAGVASNKANNFAKKNPWKFAAAGAAIGAVVTSLLSRKRNK